MAYILGNKCAKNDNSSSTYRRKCSHMFLRQCSIVQLGNLTNLVSSVRIIVRHSRTRNSDVSKLQARSQRESMSHWCVENMATGLKSVKLNVSTHGTCTLPANQLRRHDKRSQNVGFRRADAVVPPIVRCMNDTAGALTSYTSAVAVVVDRLSQRRDVLDDDQ